MHIYTHIYHTFILEPYITRFSSREKNNIVNITCDIIIIDKRKSSSQRIKTFTMSNRE